MTDREKTMYRQMFHIPFEAIMDRVAFKGDNTITLCYPDENGFFELPDKTFKFDKSKNIVSIAIRDCNSLCTLYPASLFDIFRWKDEYDAMASLRDIRLVLSRMEKTTSLEYERCQNYICKHKKDVVTVKIPRKDIVRAYDEYDNRNYSYWFLLPTEHEERTYIEVYCRSVYDNGEYDWVDVTMPMDGLRKVWIEDRPYTGKYRAGFFNVSAIARMYARQISGT